MFRDSRLRLVLTLVLALNLSAGVIVTAGCKMLGKTGQATIRAAVKAAPLMLDTLETQGAINHRQRVCAGDNFVLAGNIGIDLDSDLKAATNKNEQADAAHRAFTRSRAIKESEVDGQKCFNANPKIEKAFNLIDGIFIFIDAFYADKAGRITHSDVGADGLSDDEFKSALNSKLKELKDALEK